MTINEMRAAIQDAQEVHAKKEQEEIAIRQAELDAEYATLKDQAAPYIDSLMEEIKQGSVHGRINYEIHGLPENDFRTDGLLVTVSNLSGRGFIRSNTVTATIKEFLKNLDNHIICEAKFENGKNYLEIRL